MDNRTTLLKVLEGLQRKSLIDSGKDPITLSKDTDELLHDLATMQGLGSDEKIKANIKATNIYLNDLLNTYPPSKYQEFSDYQIILYLYKQLVQYSNNLKVNLPPLPVIGTLPTGEVNGTVLCLPNIKDYIIILQRGVFMFADSFSKVISYCFNYNEIAKVGPVLDLKVIDNELDENSLAYIYFENLIDNYIINGNIKASIRHDRFLGEGIANSLRNFSEMFVLSHEIGHIINNHLGNSQNQVRLTSEENENVNKVSYIHVFEYEADETALELMLLNEINQPSGPMFSTAGCQLILEGFDVIYKAISLLKYGNSNNIKYPDSHPAPLLRKERLLKASKEILLREKVNPILIERASDFSNLISLAVQKLWFIYEKKFHTDRKFKITISKIWNIDSSEESDMSWNGFSNSSFQTVETILSGIFGNNQFRKFLFSSLLLKQTDVHFLLIDSLFKNVLSQNDVYRRFCEKILFKLTGSLSYMESVKEIAKNDQGSETDSSLLMKAEVGIKLLEICSNNLSKFTFEELDYLGKKIKQKGLKNEKVNEILDENVQINEVEPELLELTIEYIVCKLSKKPKSKELETLLKSLDGDLLDLYDRFALYYSFCFNLYATGDQYNKVFYDKMLAFSPKDIILDLMIGSAAVSNALIKTVCNACLKIINFEYPLNDFGLNHYIKQKKFEERVFQKFYLWNVSLLINRAIELDSIAIQQWKKYL